MIAIFSPTDYATVRNNILNNDPSARFVIAVIQADADAMDGQTYDHVYVDTAGETLYQSVTVYGPKVSV